MRRQGLFQPGGLSLCRPGGACRTAVPAVYSPRRTRTRVLFYLHGSNPAYPLVHPFRRPTEACFDMVRKATNAPGGEPRAPGEDTDWPGWRLKLVRGECKVGRMSSTPVMGGTWLQETYYSRGLRRDIETLDYYLSQKTKKESNRNAVRSVSTIMSAFVAFVALHPTACLLCDSHPMCRPLLQFG